MKEKKKGKKPKAPVAEKENEVTPKGGGNFNVLSKVNTSIG